MKTVHHLLRLGALAACVATVASVALAQSTAAPAAKAVASEMAEAEVRKIDKDNRKITLKHGEIKSLDMPPMTMVFQVADAAMLDKVKAGDKVRFKARNDAGKMIVTELQPAR